MLLVPSAFLPCHEMFLLCDVPLLCHPALEQADFELKLLQTELTNPLALVFCLSNKNLTRQRVCVCGLVYQLEGKILSQVTSLLDSILT